MSEVLPPRRDSSFDAAPASGASVGAEFSRRTKLFRVWSAGACLVAVIALGWGALYFDGGQALDTLVMYSFQEHVPFGRVANFILHSMVSVPMLLAVGAIILVAILVRRRYALLWRSAVALIAANLLTQVAKDLLVRPDLGVGHALANSFPSGHVTLAVSVALILVYAVPDRWRALASVLAWAAILTISVAVLTAGWHRLSDVVAAILIATACALALLPAQWQPFDDRYRGRGVGSLAWLTLAATAVVAAIFAWRMRATLTSPVSAFALMALAENSVVGMGCAVAGFLVVASTATLSVRGVDRLAGN